DVLVLPSHTTARWKEQFGRVLVEAMACGTVPVGSSSAEIPNVIGEAGLIFPEGDIQALAASLRVLRENAGLRQKLAAAGRDRVLRHFTHRRIAEQTVNLYARTLQPQVVALPAAVS
ncbi:MAG: glycosyltransferase family 4 protein, partial [Acidobacteriales bacterium]|nr:glycosyltransferase family 4 protein [Terriglobales bacterium]